MNKKIMTITTIMLIILILVLVQLYLKYVKKQRVDITIKNNTSGETVKIAEPTNTPIPMNNETSGEFNEDNKQSVVTPEPSLYKPTEKPITTPMITQAKEIRESPENIVVESGEIDNKSENDENNIVVPVIASDNETSNQDKQQVLSEIDDALQGLLEAVGKVPTVDEDKLNMTLENGEV